MTNFEKLGAVKQAAAEKLFHVIIEAHGAGRSPYENPAFTECIAIVQGVEIASTVAHKFDAPLPSALAGQGPEGNDPDQQLATGNSLQANQNNMTHQVPTQSARPLSQGFSDEPNEERLEGKSFQVNANTVKEGDKLEG
jgi:hypothetical protein